MKSFQITRLQLFEMIDELFSDTVVICHHEKLFNISLDRLFKKILRWVLSIKPPCLLMESFRPYAWKLWNLHDLDIWQSPII